MAQTETPINSVAKTDEEIALRDLIMQFGLAVRDYSDSNAFQFQRVEKQQDVEACMDACIFFFRHTLKDALSKKDGA